MGDALTGPGRSFVKGELVRVHPASDWFMRGEKEAKVVRPEPVGDCLRVRGCRSGVAFWLPLDHILNEDEKA